MTSARIVAFALLFPVSVVHGQNAPASALTIVVLDPSGAVIPGADVTVSDSRAFVVTVQSSSAGEATVAGLRPGRYTARAAFAGFRPGVLNNVQVRSGETRRSIRLALMTVTEGVVVTGDAQSGALDTRHGAFSSLLTQDELDALPEDPDAFAAALQALAPSGAVIRIDGFTGGALPPKNLILSIRIPRADVFAAQDHVGLVSIAFIDVLTQPGGGRLQGATEVALEDASLNARSPFVGRKGNESVRAGGLTASGPMRPGQTSFSASVRGGARRDTAYLHAALPDGTIQSGASERPQNIVTATGRVITAIGESRTLRMAYSHVWNERRNLGIGDFNLPERGYTSRLSQGMLGAALSGTVGRRAYLDAHIQLETSANDATSYTEAPTVRVLDAFTAGGAQLVGGRRASALKAGVDLDYARGPHALRIGALLEKDRVRTDSASNYLGTFTFTSLADYNAGRAATYTRRVGRPNLQFGDAHIGFYAQDDVRLAASTMLSYGVRYEAQARVRDWMNVQPRLTITWSPLTTGRTTVRAGVGVFNDWIGSNVFEQISAVDGTHQRDIRIANPTYPDPDLGTATGPAPSDRYVLATAPSLPESAGLTIAFDQRLTAQSRVTVAYSRRDGRHLLRGRNLNAPVNGLRPNPALGNIIEVQSDARSRLQSVSVMTNLLLSHPRRTILSGTYALTEHEENTAGPFSVPAHDDDLASEWGVTAPRHRFTTSVTTQLLGSVNANLRGRWQSGTPYNITTGRDDNGDGLFLDRPSGAARNSARTAGQWDIAARVSYAFRFGPAADGKATLPTSSDLVSSPGVDVPGLGRSPRYRIEVFVSAQNVTNHRNLIGYSGVMGSPFFGQPTGVLNPRKLELGARFGF